MSGEHQRPLPYLTDVNRPYWTAAKRHEFLLQRCEACGHYRHPAGTSCPSCLSDKLTWVKASGRGKVYTWTVFHQVYHPAFAGEVPYAVVVVELEEGPRLATRLIDCSLEDIRIDMPVEVTFKDIDENISLPSFRPAIQGK